jgi:hypothetical protein
VAASSANRVTAPVPLSSWIEGERRKFIAATERPWTVLPHGPIEKLEPNLWAIQGSLPRGHVPRRMCIARTTDGRLLFLNAVPLREEAMSKIETFGVPAFLLVPNSLHCLDIAAYKLRYPELRILTGAGSRRRVEQLVPVHGGWEAAPRDRNVSVVPIEGTKLDEPVLIANGSGRTSLCFFGDTVMNLPHLPGLDGFLLRLLGSTGGPRVTALARWFALRDWRRVRSHLLRLADTPGLVRVVPCHGAVISRDPAGVLRRIANTL